MKTKKSLAIFGIIMIVIALLTACGGTGGGLNENTAPVLQQMTVNEQEGYIKSRDDVIPLYVKYYDAEKDKMVITANVNGIIFHSIKTTNTHYFGILHADISAIPIKNIGDVDDDGIADIGYEVIASAEDEHGLRSATETRYFKTGEDSPEITDKEEIIDIVKDELEDYGYTLTKNYNQPGLGVTDLGGIFRDSVPVQEDGANGERKYFGVEVSNGQDVPNQDSLDAYVMSITPGTQSEIIAQLGEMKARLDAHSADNYINHESSIKNIATQICEDRGVPSNKHATDYNGYYGINEDDRIYIHTDYGAIREEITTYPNSHALIFEKEATLFDSNAEEMTTEESNNWNLAKDYEENTTGRYKMDKISEPIKYNEYNELVNLRLNQIGY